MTPHHRILSLLSDLEEYSRLNDLPEVTQAVKAARDTALAELAFQLEQDLNLRIMSRLDSSEPSTVRTVSSNEIALGLG